MANSSKKRNIAIIAVPIVAIILLLVGVAIYTQSAFSSLKTNANVASLGPIGLNVSISASGVATYSNAQLFAPYVVARYVSSNTNYLTLLFNVYSRNALPNVYYVNTTNYCYQCYSDGALVANLTAYLTRYGIIGPYSTFNYIKPTQLKSVPANSIIIVPTGLLPIYMVPGATYVLNGSATLPALLNESDTIFFIGSNFSRSSGPGGVIFSNSNATISIFNNIGLSSAAFANKNASKAFSYFNLPTFGFITGGYYGYATYVNSYNGTVVSFSNSQRNGWQNTSALAYDIAVALTNRFWLKPLASASYSKGAPITSGTIGVPAISTYIANNKSTAGRVLNSSYGLLSAIAYNGSAVVERTIPVKTPLIANGSLGVQPYLGQTQSVPLSISINVNSTKLVQVLPHIDLYTKNLTFLTSIPVPFFNTTSNINIIKYYSFALPSGTYIAFLRNFYNKYYSSALFNVTPITLTPISLGFANGSFSFLVRSNNVPVTNTTYTIDLNGAYRKNGNITNGVINYTLPKGTVIGYGNETFNLQMFGSTYSYSASNVQQVLNIPTIYIEFVIVGLAVLILNLIVKPPNRDEYYIDVPEFREAKKIDVKVNRNEVISVFDKVNFNYHWKYMPLTLEEIKSGISANVRYNNMPVSITVQNTALIMSKLALDGDIVSSNGYYAPKRWSSESGYNIEYLAIFRKIRDFCVGHAMLFTDISASAEADIILSKGGSRTNVIIYTNESGMRKVDIDSTMKSYIVFSDEESLLKFTDKLYRSYGKQAEILKMGISYGYLRLVEANGLDQIVF